jgi:hypothetical protein
MAKKLTDDEVGALVDGELRTALGFGSGKLAEQRRKAEEYFYGEAKGDLSPPEIVGRSSVVVPVVRNTIESMLPQLMVKFTGGDSVVDFEPTLQDDEKKAKQATDYLNYLFFKKNNGHAVTYAWFKDALKLKRGVVKVWWDERDEETRETYRGQTPVNLAMLEDDKELEIIEQKSYPDEEDAEQRKEALEQLQQQMDQAMMAAQQNPQAAEAVGQIQARMEQISSMPPALKFDLVCKRVKSGGKITIENVPPEEFFISRDAKDIGSARICGHRFRRTISHLRSMGYPQSLIDELGNDDSGSENAERIERLAYDDEYADLNANAGDESQREVWVTEAYYRCDADGDGIAELRKVTRAGGKTLDNEIADVAPFVTICPVPEPHKFFGLSVADLAMEGQKTETALLRSSLDNMYLEVNGRYFAVEGQVNLDDLLSSRPGGIVRTKSQGAVGRLDQGKGSIGEAMTMLEFMKGFNEDSTGWSRQSQGNDPTALKGGETATKTNIVTNRADMRLDLIARNFAEGFVDLFRLMLKLVCQHQDKAAAIRLGGEWVDMDPREWRNQFDVSINVGLGVGSKDQQVQHLMMLQQTQANGLQIGIATPENLYNSSLELAKNMGFKSGDKFFTKPDPTKPLPNPGQAEAQGKMQTEKAKLEAQAAMKQMELQHKGQMEQLQMQQDAALTEMKARYQAMVDQNRQQSEAAQQQAKIEMEAQFESLKSHYEDQRHQREMAFQQWKLQGELASKERIAQINAESKIDAAQLAAKTTLSAQQEGASDKAVE